jgi:FeS assembly protein IscX
MSINPISPPLYWEATYAIALRLMEAHANIDVETVGIEQVYQWVVALPEFADDPALGSEAILNDILREWFEETNV